MVFGEHLHFIGLSLYYLAKNSHLLNIYFIQQ